MLTETGRRRSIEVDYERDPFTDLETVKGIERRIGNDYGLGVADLAEYILDYFGSLKDPGAAVEGITRVCSEVIMTQRFARMIMFEERMGVSERHHLEAFERSREKTRGRPEVEIR